MGVKSWRLVAMLSVSETVAWGALYYSFGVLLRPFASHLGVSETSIAGAFSVAMLTSALAAAGVGASVDRWGPRPVMTIGAVLGAGGLASLAAVDGVAGFYLGWATIGVSHACALYEPAFAAIAKWYPAPSQRARALLFLTSMAGFASTIFVPVTAAVYAQCGRQRTLFVLAAMVALVALPLNAALPRWKASATRSRERRADAEGSSRQALLALVFSAQAFAAAGVTVHLVSYLRADGLDLMTAAAITGLMGAAQVPARLVFRVFQRFVPGRARLPLLLGLQALALVVVLARGHAVVAFAVVIFGAPNGLLTLERAVVVAEWFDAEEYGAVSGRIAAFANATRAAGPVTVGLVTGATSYSTSFLGLAALTAFAAAFLWRSTRPPTTARRVLGPAADDR